MKTLIILPISRKDYLQQVFVHLENLDTMNEEVGILAYVDGDYPLFETAQRYIDQSKFNYKRTIYRNKGNPNDTGVLERRQRIANIHNELKQYIPECEFVLLTEDDTLLPALAYKNLRSIYNYYPRAGMVTGVQTGRWGYKMLGLWHIDNVYNPRKIESAKIQTGDKKIDASGFYCMLTRRETYIQPKHIIYSTILGPDFAYGMYLRQEGYTNYVCYNVHTVHINKKEILTPQQADTVIRFTRTDEGWEQEVL